jgi:tetratricopeptide (TPR) repeat protein
MTDEIVVEKTEPEPLPVVDETVAAKPESRTLNLGWRLAMGLLAVVIVGVLVYPFIQQQLSGGEQANTPTTLPNLQPPAPDLEATLQADPNSPEAYFKLGNSYYEVGQWDQAVAAYQQAITLDPNYQAAYANLGVAYYQQQQFDLAISQYKKALELDQNDNEVAYNLGALYVQQALSSVDGQPDLDLLNQAVKQLEDVVGANPELAEPHFTLGVASWALNQNAEAIEAFETFLSLDKSGSGSQARQEAERYLQLLKEQ